MKFRLDIISFFIGMIVSTLVWWMLSFLRPIVENGISDFRKKKANKSLESTSEIEISYRKALYKRVQGLHFVSSLFSLDEIVQEPLLMAPPIESDSSSLQAHKDVVELTLPYLPSYPELSTFYHGPTLTIPQVLSGNMNIVIIGKAGSGKSTALAYVAAQYSKISQKSLDVLQFTPFLIHVADLELILNGPLKDLKTQDYLKPIIENITQSVGILESGRIPSFVESTFTNKNPLLLVDGLDELPQAQIQKVTAYFQNFLHFFPRTRIITTGSLEYIDGLSSIGFAPLTLMPWNQDQQLKFLKKWETLWSNYVSKESWLQQKITAVDSTLLNSWLTSDNFGLTPLEFTLKLWGAYAGDCKSVKPIDLMEAYIKRIFPQVIPLEITTNLALQIINNQSVIFDESQATPWLKSEDSAELISPDPNQQQLARNNSIPALTASGILTRHHNNRLRFFHPSILGFFAGKGLVAKKREEVIEVLNQPNWSGQSLSLLYLAGFSEKVEIAADLLAKEDPILKRPIFLAASLLHYASSNESSWRTSIMSALVKILQDEENPFGLRCEAMVALVLSGDLKVSSFFRQLLQSNSDEVLRLASLGSGLMRDSKSIDLLIELVTSSNDSVRRAASLALIRINTPKALEAVAINLLQGDEQLRIYSAEALADHLPDGQEALREGIASQDILVRRAIVYGLAKVNEDWSTELLEKIQINDEQWAVRNVAIESLKAQQSPNPRIPHQMTPSHETPWLLEFAGTLGMGIAPGQPSTDILLRALKAPDQSLLKPALSRLRFYPGESVFAVLYPFLFGNDLEAREAVFQTLLFMAQSGASLPHPQQFGLS